MSIVVVGSVALDTIETPLGVSANVLGGSATYFSVAARLFASVQLVAVVGSDLPKAALAPLRRRGIDAGGLVTVPGKTFRWSGRYHADFNTRTTLATELNVFAAFRPELPAAFAGAPCVFLANIDPDVQLDVLRQACLPRETGAGRRARAPRLVASDTIELWIRTKRERLLEVLRRVDLFFINDEEAKLLAQTPHLYRAARWLLERGPRIVFIKKGEHGSMLCHGRHRFFVPAYPLEEILDPTGAGDTFAGGVLGYLSRVGLARIAHEPTLRKAAVHGAALASFCVEGVGVSALARVTPERLRRRVQAFRRLMHIDG